MNMFFIDADNLSSTQWIEEGFQFIESTYGALSVRRAYGSPENLRPLAEILKARAMRQFPNLSLNKNTTDMALAVDAMEFACQAIKPTCVAIGSGDADFLPLVVRLRERGIHVLCVASKTKMAPEAVYAYDKVFFVSESAPKAIVALPKVAKEVVLRTPKTAATAATATPAKKTKAPTKKSAATVPVKPPCTLDDLLDAAPKLRTMEWITLGDVVKLLHDKKLLSKSASSPKFFEKFGARFELAPKKQPNKVRMV